MNNLRAATTVLYIEDDRSNRHLVNKLLSNDGYRVIEADNALTGIDMALDMQPDLILMDMNMFGLDGYEAATRLKNMG